MGLGTAATTIPIAGCEDNKAGLPEVMLDPGPGVPASALLAWASPGNGEVSFCSCCFF